MTKQNHVAANLQQDFTDAEKEQARINIGASQVQDRQCTHRYLRSV